LQLIIIMALPLSVAIKDFLGLYVVTPFERELLRRLGEALGPDDREVLEFQLAHFTTVRRLIRHLDEPNAYGYTFFYTLRFGKDVSARRQTKRFASPDVEALLASARVIFDGGQIDVTFGLVRGVLFSIQYRSPQKIYYPPGDYRVEAFSVWPARSSPVRSR
jgi:hypothetical protein